jgi:hypothetical protein
MTEPTIKELPDEDRLMALLALNSQELPQDPGVSQSDVRDLDPDQLSVAQLEALHAHLDANPEAFERFLRTHRTASPLSVTATPALRSQRDPWWQRWLDFAMPLQPRYALAASVALICAGVLAWALLAREPSPTAVVDSGYAELSAVMDAATAASIQAQGNEGFTKFGFSPRVATDVANSFAEGVREGERRFAAGATTATRASGNSTSEYALGEWNVLLWTASESRSALPANFWRAQRLHHRQLVDALSAQSQKDAMLAAHLQRVDGLLLDLAQQQRPARSARMLADEVRLFRSQYAPASEAR